MASGVDAVSLIFARGNGEYPRKRGNEEEEEEEESSGDLELRKCRLTRKSSIDQSIHSTIPSCLQSCRSSQALPFQFSAVEDPNNRRSAIACSWSWLE